MTSIFYWSLNIWLWFRWEVDIWLLYWLRIVHMTDNLLLICTSSTYLANSLPKQWDNCPRLAVHTVVSRFTRLRNASELHKSNHGGLAVAEWSLLTTRFSYYLNVRAFGGSKPVLDHLHTAWPMPELDSKPRAKMYWNLIGKKSRICPIWGNLIHFGAQIRHFSLHLDWNHLRVGKWTN